MNRAVRGLITAILLASLFGCSGRPSLEPPVSAPSPAPAAAPDPVPASTPDPAPDPAPAPPQPPAGEPVLAVLDDEPIDYIPEGMYRYPEVSVYPNACHSGVTPEGSLAVEIRAAEWRPHPWNAGFWAPAVTIMVCNQGAQRIERSELALTMVRDGQSANAGSAQFEDLNPGEGVGPLRFYAEAAGVPAKVGQLWAADGQRWPAWTLRVEERARGEGRLIAEAPVDRRLAGSDLSAGDTQPSEFVWPDLPSLAFLTALARSQATFHDGNQEVVVFLYAPDTNNWMNTSAYCGSNRGSVEAKAGHWSFYLSRGGEAPVLAWEIGPYEFVGSRGMGIQSVPELNMTFMTLANYGSCAVSMVYELYAYDHVKGDIFPVQMRRGDGSEGLASVATFNFSPDGKLSSTYYNNMDGKTHTNHYNWDAENRMWIFDFHTPE